MVSMEPSERISLAAVARACAENMSPSDLGTSTSTSNGVGGAAAAGSHAESIKRTKNKKASTVTARLGPGGTGIVSVEGGLRVLSGIAVACPSGVRPLSSPLLEINI